MPTTMAIRAPIVVVRAQAPQRPTEASIRAAVVSVSSMRRR